MRVLVTGGTGFIGSHSVSEIVRCGHSVRLLLREPDRLVRALAPLGVDAAAVEAVPGDVTDPAVVTRAVRGCDAVLHAAAVYSFDTRRHGTMRRVNARGTEVVLEAARRAGADPIVHVSTFGVLASTGPGPVTVQAAVARRREAYFATKTQAEAIARRHQDDGAPVVITYPLAALGPDDPNLGDQATRVRNVLRGLMPLWPLGGFPIGDVRDVARLHAALLRPDQGPRRFMGPGGHVRSRDIVRALRRVTGRAVPTGYLPARAMLPVGALVGLLQRAVPVHLPAEYGAIYTCLFGRPVDTSATDRLLGGPGRPLATTLADTVRWLHAAGHLSRRQAGRAAVVDGFGSTAHAEKTPHLR